MEPAPGRSGRTGGEFRRIDVRTNAQGKPLCPNCI